jgi:photosystem II stability/assembly factor-like uncharacterized protein
MYKCIVRRKYLMKNRISKISGIGLSAGVVFGLIGTLFAAPVSADLMEWGLVNTPSWEDNVIVPGADIYDYAVGGDDGNTIYAAGAIKGGNDGMTPQDSYLAGITGSFYISSGSITVAAISSDVANFTGDLNGWSCVIRGAFAMYLELSWATSTGHALVSGEVSDDKMTFTGKLYLDTGSLPADGDYDCDEEPICIEDNQIRPTKIAMGDFSILNDGETTASVYYQPRLWKSTDGGVSWTDITAKVQAADNLPSPFFVMTSVAVAPDDEDWLALGGHDMDFMTGTNLMVVASKDGGDNFAYTGDLEDTTHSTQFGSLRDMAISPEVDGIHNIALAGSSVYRLQAGTWLGGSWEDTSFYAGWENGVVNPPIKIVIVLAFSPNFDIDDTILCLGWDDVSIHYPYLQSGVWEGSGGAWNDAAGFPQAVKITDDGDTLSLTVPDDLLDARRSLGLALPADYDGSDPGARTVFAYVDARNLVTGLIGGYVFRIDNASVGPAFGPRGEPLLASIAFHGDADTGKMMVGTYLGWDQDLNEPIQPDCCAGVAVYHTEELDPCCPAWEGSCKDPSGPFMALVSYTPDGEKAYATTSGFMVDYSYYWVDPIVLLGVAGGIGDESAFSVSRDDGVSWNQLGLIDTDIDWLSDVAVCPDCSTIYLSTINVLECWTCDECEIVGAEPVTMDVCEVCECDSVWRSYDDGDTWERVFHGDWDDGQGDGLPLLRLPCDAIEDCCDQDPVSPSGTIYVGLNDMKTMFYSRDCGQCWNETPATKIPIQDFAVESENIVYVIDDAGMFSKSTQYGRRWSDAIDTGLDTGHTITSCCNEGFVVVGGYGGDPVAWSDDGGDSWNLTDDIPEAGDVHVACDPKCVGTIYAAVDSIDFGPSCIYRTTTDSGEWTNMNAMDIGYTGIVVAREGTLYASSDEILVDSCGDLCDRFIDEDHAFVLFDDGDGEALPACTIERYSGVARNLTPCETACCGTEDWDYLICGLSPQATGSEYFDLQPSALRICGCLSVNTNSILWAIDGEDYDVTDGSDGALWSYEDCAAKMGPTLTSPPDGAVIDCEPCAGCDAANFTLKWERMCEACSYDIEIMDENGNVIVSWTDEEVVGDPPSLFVDENLECGMTYTWHVREANTSCECVHSPWSDTRSFTIAVGAADAIQLLSPEKGAMGTPIENIGFSWTSVRNATAYSFILSPNAVLTGALITQNQSSTAFNYAGPLDYGKAYYWQVIAWEDGTRLSTSSIGVFNTMAQPVASTPPVVIEEQPAPVINIPPAQQITPTWIYAIIGIGAALAVVVIVLIVRTRRP